MDAVVKTPSKLIKILKCLIKHWEKKVIKDKKYGKEKQELIKEYRDLRVWDINNRGVPHTIFNRADWIKGQGGGWGILAKPVGWDKDEDQLKTFPNK